MYLSIKYVNKVTKYSTTKYYFATEYCTEYHASSYVSLSFYEYVKHRKSLSLSLFILLAVTLPFFPRGISILISIWHNGDLQGFSRVQPRIFRSESDDCVHRTKITSRNNARARARLPQMKKNDRRLQRHRNEFCENRTLAKVHPISAFVQEERRH